MHRTGRAIGQDSCLPFMDNSLWDGWQDGHGWNGSEAKLGHPINGTAL